MSTLEGVGEAVGVVGTSMGYWGERSSTLRGGLEREGREGGVEYNKKGTEYHEKGLEYSTTRSTSCRRLGRE